MITPLTNANNPITELLPVQHHSENGEVVHFIEARQLHTFLENKRQFTDWIKQRIAKYGFIEGQDYFTDHKFVKRKTTRGAISLSMTH